MVQYWLKTFLYNVFISTSFRYTCIVHPIKITMYKNVPINNHTWTRLLLARLTWQLCCVIPSQYLFRRLAVIFFCHVCVKIALPVSVLTFSTHADLYLRFLYLHFPPLSIVLRFSVLAYSIPRYLPFPYLHFQSPPAVIRDWLSIYFTAVFLRHCFTTDNLLTLWSQSGQLYINRSCSKYKHTKHMWLGSVVVERQTCDREVASSTPGRWIAG